MGLAQVGMGFLDDDAGLGEARRRFPGDGATSGSTGVMPRSGE